jgi:hypothetical protein
MSAPAGSTKPFPIRLTHLAGRPDLIKATVEHIASFHEQYYSRFACAVRGRYDIVAWGDDFASQQGLLLSPGKWREIFLPVWKRMFAIAHENGMKAALHACGSIRAIPSDLVDVGLDILEIVHTMKPDAIVRSGIGFINRTAGPSRQLRFS